MSHLLPPAIFLMGPTAAGKTDLALDLARVLPCELISVDSALVYRGMDIGTAKPDKATLAEFPHRLVDIRDPAESYSAAEFRSDALAAMAEATARGRIPLLVGGTMLYYKALLEGLADMPGADPLLRAELEARRLRYEASQKVQRSSRTELLTALRRKVTATALENYCTQSKVKAEDLEKKTKITEMSRCVLSEYYYRSDCVFAAYTGILY